MAGSTPGFLRERHDSGSTGVVRGLLSFAIFVVFWVQLRHVRADEARQLFLLHMLDLQSGHRAEAERSHSKNERDALSATGDHVA